MAYTKLFNWLTDLVRNEKIIAARLDAEFDAIAASSADSIHITQASPSGSVQGEYNFNDIAVTSNMTVLAGSPSTQDPFADHVSSGIKITMDEGTSAEGFQIPLLVRLNHEVSTDIWQVGAPADHIVVAAQGYSNAADTSNSSAGAGIYSGSFALYLASGAIHQHVVGLNPEIITETGVTIKNRVGVRSQSMGDSGARGADLDAAYTIVSLTNSWKDGIVFGEPNAFTGTAPIHTSGSLMSCVVTCTVSSAFNLGLVTCTADIFKFGSVFQVQGNGHHIVTLNSTTNTGYQTANSNSGGVAGFTALSDLGAGTIGDFGVRCSARASYGALVARDAYVYGNGTTGVTIMADNGTGVIKFAAGGNTEKVRIASGGLSSGSPGAFNGASLLGDPGNSGFSSKTTNGWASDFYSSASGVGGGCIRFRLDNASELFAAFRHTTSTIGSIADSGGTTTVYNTTSDKTLKFDERPFTRAGEIIDALDIHDFAWKANPEQRGVGVFAQDAYPIFPDAIRPGEGEMPWQADYSKYVPVLLAELKALRARVAELENAH